MDDTNPRQIARRLLNHAALLVIIFISPLFSSVVSAQSLPPGWAVADVGSPAIQGYATYSNQTFTVSGAGSGIGGATDQFTIAYRQLTGDGTIVARVGALPALVPGAHAGVMIRQELSAGAAHASVLVSRSDGITFTRRRSGGGGTSNTAAGSGTSAVWVRVDRRSSTVTASYSADGSTWTLLGTDTVTMNNVLYVGLAVSSRLTVAAVQATFTGVQVMSLVEYGGPLPAGWSSQDLGAPGQPGAAAYDAGTFGLVGGGSNIGGTWDQFRFAYGQVTADVDIVARVRDLGNTNAFSKAGVMIRDSLTPNGAHASMFVTASGTTLFRRRPSGGQGSVDTSGPSNQAPVWLKLSLRNGVVSGYQSLDGVSWALVGTQTLTLPTPYYVGLAVTSADNAATVTTNIDNVQVTAAANAAPTVALTEPASGSTYVEPATIVISANASDTDGTVTRVDFFQGTTLIGSDTTSPYSFTWTDVPAGTYSLTARATDDDGATTTSSARFVTVNLNPNQPPSVAVTAPASGSTYTAPASITINATASDTDGTITRVDFFQGTTVIGSDTTSPYSFTWTNVPAGTYSLTARATDDDGATTTSAAVFVTVNQPANQAPSVALTAPANGATYTAPASITIDATASDADGTVTRVDFFQGTTQIGSDTTSPYSFTWTNVPAGTYSLTARATDNAGAVTTSAARTVTVTAAGLPAGWTAADVGTPTPAGRTSFANGTFSVTGGGADIFGTADQFHFAYQQVSGDIDVVARVATLGQTNAFSKAGVMIRESLAGNAANAAMVVTPAQGLRFTRRSTAGATTASTAGGSNQPPVWVKLSRRGGTITSFSSVDGTTWTQVGTDTLTLPATFYVGLAVTSHDTAATVDATLDNVVVQAPAANQPPTVALTAPANGATYTAPASITIDATAGDTDGTVTRVDFFQGATLLGSDTTSPYSFTWNNVPAGTYSLTAQAVDDDGAATMSAARTVTVNPPANQPPSVALTAPANGATYTAPASITIDATASDTDGTIARVDFFQGTTLLGSDTTSPYSFTWTNVPAGTYSLTARATDDDGATTTSAAVFVTVNPPANQAPTVALTAPANGATYTAPASITIDATASDADGTVTRVDFFQGTTQIGSDTTSPYSFTWSNVPTGTYSLTARATDNGGAVTTSAARTVTVTAGGLPAGWTAADVGNPTPAGRTSFANGTYSITGGGADIFGTADQFHFAYQQVSGDIDVVARVATLGQTNAFSKAGVMIRESLAGNAANAAMVVTPAQGLRFTRRTSAGATTASTVGGSNQPPVWVKLSRRGGTITSFSSVDGTTWTQVGTDTLTLPSTFYVGLAVTSHDTAATVDATLDNVLVQAPGPNQAPTVSLTAPANGATYTAPASITIDATAGDADGTVTRVDFFQGTTLIGSDTTSPYSFTWTNVPAGTYSLTARATDNVGATTASAARTVTVNPPAAQQRTAVFNPSPDHNTLVNSYLLEIFAAGANPATATPIATQNLGKPAIVNGECSADVTATINALAAGNYQATVSAVGSGGSSRSAAVNFTR